MGPVAGSVQVVRHPSPVEHPYGRRTPCFILQSIGLGSGWYPAASSGKTRSPALALSTCLPVLLRTYPAIEPTDLSLILFAKFHSF